MNNEAQALLAAARALADTRVEEAEMFLSYRMQGQTNAQAERMATVETGSRVTVAEAEYQIALRQLQLAECDPDTERRAD